MPRHSPYALLRLNFLFYSLFSELLEFLRKQDNFFRIKKVFLFSLPPFGEIVVLLAKAKQFTLIWKDSISFKIVSSLSVRFFNSF